MNHAQAVKNSSYGFGVRNKMLINDEEHWLFSMGRYCRLIVSNAACFSDWQPLENPQLLEPLKKRYLYIKIQQIRKPKKPRAPRKKKNDSSNQT